MNTRRAPSLTECEIEALIAVSGDADSWATCLSVTDDERAAVQLHDAYERGIAKLVVMLARRREARQRRNTRGR